MTLQDILQQLNLLDKNIKNIQYRLVSSHEGFEDELFGYCSYLNGELIPEDGDIYSLNDEFDSFYYDKESNQLIVYQNTKYWPMDYPEGCKLNCKLCDIKDCEDRII